MVLITEINIKLEFMDQEFTEIQLFLDGTEIESVLESDSENGFIMQYKTYTTFNSYHKVLLKYKRENRNEEKIFDIDLGTVYYPVINFKKDII